MNINEFLIRLGVVIAIGLCIGLERQLTKHNVNIRTTTLIAISTFAFVSVEVLFGNTDMRVSANIVTGIGFLCSGVILKNGLSINGLSTSATLWGTAGISMLATYGYTKYALISTAALTICNFISNILFSKLNQENTYIEDEGTMCKIKITCGKELIDTIQDIIDELDNHNLYIKKFQITKIDDNLYKINYNLLITDNVLDNITELKTQLIKENITSLTIDTTN